MLSLYRPFSNRRTRCRCGRLCYEAGGVARARVGRITGACARGGAECKWVGNTAGRRRRVAAARTLTNPYKPKPRVAPEVRYEPAASYSGSRPGMVFKRGDRGVGYYEDPLAPRVLMPTEPTPEADAADVGPAVLERLKAKLRQDMDAAAPPADDAPAKDEFCARSRTPTRPPTLPPHQTRPSRRPSPSHRQSPSTRPGHRRSTPSPRPSRPPHHPCS